MRILPNTHLCSRITPHHTYIGEKAAPTIGTRDTGPTNNEGSAHIDDGAHPFHPSLPKNPCGLHSYSSKGRPRSHLLGWRALCRQHPSLLKNSPKQRLSRCRENRAHILRTLHYVQTEHASRHPRSRIWTVLEWLRTYRTASAGVFTLNTHSRSRIWTVLDGESYTAALR